MVSALKTPQLILASQSPRRRQLLAEAGWSFEVWAADPAVEEAVRFRGDAKEYVSAAAAAKGQAVVAAVQQAGRQTGWVLAADTVAVLDGDILGKPLDLEDARNMLRRLAGRAHQVLTGVWLHDLETRRTVSAVEATTLQMDPLTNDMLENYLASGAWQGKAGAFGYQDGWDWLRVIEGLESNVVGLPVERLPSYLQAIASS